jgi:hypothetical protein
MKHFSNRPQLGFCCQYQINLAAPGGGQFAASIVGNCQPSEKDKIFSLIPEAISYHLNRISFAVVLAAQIIGSTLIVLSDIPLRWHEISIIGLSGFLVAGGMGWWDLPILFSFELHKKIM